MNKVFIFFKKNTPTILSIIASTGVAITTISAVKATSKALKLIEEAENVETKVISIGGTEYESILKRELTLKTKIKVAWKPYIPTFCMGISTILCIFGSNFINKRNQKSLISAYMLLNNSYLKYRDEIKKIYGNETDKNIFKNIVEDIKEDTSKSFINDEELFFDCQSMRYFNSTMDNVKKAEYVLNKLLSTNEYVYLNDLYDILGIDKVDYGYDIGWSTSLNDSLYSYDKITFDMELTEIDSGLECWIINYSCPPNMNY